MGNNKDEDIEKEYAELKFLYAMENEKFRKLFDRWKKEESKFDKLDHEKYVKEKGSSKICQWTIILTHYRTIKLTHPLAISLC
jgi:hypothetical protein